MASHQSPSCSLMVRNIIVAVADNLAIGKGNDMPWHISEDLRYFRRTTSGFPVIMGRNTYLSIGRPLPGRLNIVVSRTSGPIEGVTVVRSLEEAYAVAESASDSCFIMGGAMVYKTAIAEADALYITHVHTVIGDADAFFPEIDPSIWEVSSKTETKTDPETGFEFEFVVYTRK